ncbi:MAG: POTRA domain-containing protein [Ferruginibacter sp.]
MKRNYFFLLLICTFCNASFVIAQSQINNTIKPDSSKIIVVTDVLISGNKKTKTYLIKREMLLKKGDTIKIKNLPDLLTQSQNLIYNTTLFTKVELVPIYKDSNELIIIVDLKEKWYIYPLPQFQLIARNFNDWINTYNADLDRVVYGVKFTHYNLSGRRDKLNIYLLNGYSKNISLSYSAPYSNSSLTQGFGFATGYTANRNISYKTSYNNKVLQFTNDKFVNSNFIIGGAFSLRKGYYTRHTLGLNFQFIKVDEIILKPAFNPNYFKSENSKQIISDIAYTLQYSKVDNAPYPLKGKSLAFQFLKRGTGFSGVTNMTQLTGSFAKYITHKKNWYSSYSIQTKIKFPLNLAYINQSALGYGDYNLRGLEYYVIDGPVSAVAKYTLKKKLTSFTIPLPFRLKTIPNIPVSIFIKGYADAGYGYNNQDYKAYLNNKLLYTGGFGIDILTFYDINLRIEYSFNQLNENGLFLHSNGGF